MNYIKQLNALYDWLQENKLSVSASSLYHTLLMINNRCGWTAWFQRTNQSLCGLIGIDEKTLIRARNELKQKGLIDFKSGNKKGEPTKYKIIDLTGEKDGNIPVNNTKAGIFPVEPPVKPPVKPPVQPPVEPPAIYKLKLKQKHKQEDDDEDDDNKAADGKGFQKLRKVFEDNVHLITPFEAQVLLEWLNRVEPDVVEMAIQEAVKSNARNIRYIEKVLINWHSNGLTTADAVKGYLRDYQDKSKGGKVANAADRGNIVSGDVQRFYARGLD
ncbi:DnaD and phage-associated domain-containing protein [Carboxydocella sporoproducens DSM 16521]|uniref:DnaD and phage-associated domain-containing protein n=1 Tax=Carboxydocella sporoproducens DSM 16521 TaxID=1121270 RepID=A0A1T4QFC2_9FIRM|nr:DnaD domain protein [Carboxydocella sporoproducens]SKA01928.1 DnaD and phage-associated domain-containing protein [Carboxydocella sporoproducens DSM 16521]